MSSLGLMSEKVREGARRTQGASGYRGEEGESSSGVPWCQASPSSPCFMGGP